jgi:hypothetical protein
MGPHVEIMTGVVSNYSCIENNVGWPQSQLDDMVKTGLLHMNPGFTS